ncbi:MAG: type II toxin-antitoxin system RelE/ParE family toxin [Planctomycetales bacterium]|nr:type II toxin-antitoxin system RelE/ParE family toxin [Planctomycetales bacterium]
MTYSVVILGQARRDVDHIFNWLAERSSPGATRWYDAFTEAVERLSHDADECGLVPESDQIDIEIRQRLFKTRHGLLYRIVFNIVGDEARILRVREPGQRPLTRNDI